MGRVLGIWRWKSRAPKLRSLIMMHTTNIFISLPPDVEPRAKVKGKGGSKGGPYSSNR